jgi:predicted secreted hydrolase
MKRRDFLWSPLTLVAPHAVAAVAYPAVEAGRTLVFPRDFGSHPDYRTEWWYLTATLRDGDGNALGVQITFFRTRAPFESAGASRFAPRQLLFAHAAVALPQRGRLVVDQRAARAGLGLAEASEVTTDVRIGDWSLVRDDRGYRTRIAAREFALELDFAPRTPPLLQGNAGVSRKGPSTAQASFYYSEPQLTTRGMVTVDGRRRTVDGVAWLDHEWSSEYLAKDARGWDWTGLNLDDGGALMAFRIRDRTGATYWAGGSLRDAAGNVTVLGPDDVTFTPQRSWRSPRTGIDYPVAFRLQAGAVDVTLEPLFDDQELDARGSVGTVYWEGVVTVTRAGTRVGRGYLELTGYGAPLRL